MLNLTDLARLLMIVLGPLSGVAAAHQHKAGLLSLILFGIIGLLIGVGVGEVSSKVAYRVLCANTLPLGLTLAIYMLIPLVSLLLVAVAPLAIVTAVY
jgi:hypothetical protein